MNDDYHSAYKKEFRLMDDMLESINEANDYISLLKRLVSSQQKLIESMRENIRLKEERIAILEKHADALEKMIDEHASE